MIDTPDFIAFLIAAAVMVITPGNDVVFIASQCLSRGLSGGVLAVLGVSFGVCFHLAALALGLSELVAHFPWLFHTIKIGGIAYLLWLAWSSFRRKEVVVEQEAHGHLGRVFWRGALTNIINPKALLFFLAFIPQFLDPERGNILGQILFLGTIFLIMETVGNMGYALLFGKAFSKIAHSDRFQKLIGRITGVVFVGLAVRMLVI
jgi:threonine/homoserine/homoserine lactone efflux protein